ncbi:hypothetical protein BX666DRAFT_867168 [Dichotomocladium elegans]|nr:hypothetical protein BX666DRAFT_867168 [Dichotomocladium elegans]
MSPHPEYERDENEPDEDESPISKTGGGVSGTPSPSGTSSSAISSPSGASPVPISIIVPVVVAAVVIIVLIICSILYCTRLRKRLNNGQRTQSINGWPSFLARFQTTPKTQQQQHHDEARSPEMLSPVTATSDMNHYADPAAVQQYYLMSKPPPLYPIDNGPEYQNMAPGKDYANESNKYHMHEDLAPPGAIFHAAPAPMPGQLYPHGTATHEYNHPGTNLNMMKPDERT